MRKLLIISMVCLLQACYDDISDIQQYMNDVKMNTKSRVDPIPEIDEFVHVQYSVAGNRSPFDLPSREVVQESFVSVQNCLAPDPRRRKQPLEKFALDNLAMKGTLGTNNEIWALIEASDGSLHRVTKGNYAGLFNGRIVDVSDTQVSLIELIPDGAGCWKERASYVQMVEEAADE